MANFQFRFRYRSLNQKGGFGRTLADGTRSAAQPKNRDFITQQLQTVVVVSLDPKKGSQP